MSVFHRLARHLDEMNRAILALVQKRKDEMANLHDTLLAAAKAARASVQQLAAQKIETEQQMQDVLTELEAIKAEADNAARDNASVGSSTGGGSGAGTS